MADWVVYKMIIPPIDIRPILRKRVRGILYPRLHIATTMDIWEKMYHTALHIYKKQTARTLNARGLNWRNTRGEWRPDSLRSKWSYSGIGPSRSLVDFLYIYGNAVLHRLAIKQSGLGGLIDWLINYRLNVLWASKLVTMVKCLQLHKSSGRNWWLISVPHRGKDWDK
jgi:hypothetical protein